MNGSSRCCGSYCEVIRDGLSLLKTNPFPDHPPRFLRARYYRYRFTTAEERRQTGRWWNRQLVSEYVPPITLAAFDAIACAATHADDHAHWKLNPPIRPSTSSISPIK